MSVLEQAQRLVSLMSDDEKLQLVRLVSSELKGDWGVESSPDVLGGEARIVRTRIPVWLLERARRLGATPEVLLESFPSLNSNDLANAWAYVASHREEIEEQIRANEED